MVEVKDAGPWEKDERRNIAFQQNQIDNKFKLHIVSLQISAVAFVLKLYRN